MTDRDDHFVVRHIFDEMAEDDFGPLARLMTGKHQVRFNVHPSARCCSVCLDLGDEILFVKGAERRFRANGAYSLYTLLIDTLGCT